MRIAHELAIYSYRCTQACSRATRRASGPRRVSGFPTLQLDDRAISLGEQPTGNVLRHKVPRTRRHNSVALIIQYMHEMLLERFNIAAPMKCNESGLVKTHFTTRCHDLSRRNAWPCVHWMPARLLDAL